MPYRPNHDITDMNVNDPIPLFMFFSFKMGQFVKGGVARREGSVRFGGSKAFSQGLGPLTRIPNDFAPRHLPEQLGGSPLPSFEFAQSFEFRASAGRKR